jgi:hypothetical protein
MTAGFLVKNVLELGHVPFRPSDDDLSWNGELGCHSSSFRLLHDALLGFDAAEMSTLSEDRQVRWPSFEEPLPYQVIPDQVCETVRSEQLVALPIPSYRFEVREG